MNTPGSITGDYLSGRKRSRPRAAAKGQRTALKVLGAAENNLRHIDVRFPLGTFTCVTGVSGSGKSSLVNEILYKKLGADLNRVKVRPGSTTASRGGVSGQGHSTSTSPPSAARPGPTRPPIPGCSTTSGSCSPPPRTPRPGLRPGRSPSTPGRPVRGLRRRRPAEDRDALPARHLCPLRGVQGQALQPGDPGGPLQGQEHL